MNEYDGLWSNLEVPGYVIDLLRILLELGLDPLDQARAPVVEPCVTRRIPNHLDLFFFSRVDADRHLTVIQRSVRFCPVPLVTLVGLLELYIPVFCLARRVQNGRLDLYEIAVDRPGLLRDLFPRVPLRPLHV